MQTPTNRPSSSHPREHSPRSFTARVIAAVALLLGSACNTDPAVFVDAEVTSPVLAISGGTLGSSLSGSFVLSLHLSARASGASDVSFGSFSIVDEAGGVVLDALDAVPSEPSPVTVEPDTTVDVTFTIDTGDEPVSDAVASALCAGPVAFRVTIEDSLESGSSPITSDAFDVTGCAP